MRKYIVVVFALLAGAFGASGQQRAVVTELEDNTEYLDLVAREGGLVRRADSIAGCVAELRRTLRSDTLNRAANSAAILKMEQEGFELRGIMAGLTGRINAIEQEWILQNLDGEGRRRNEGPGSVAIAVPGRPEANSANLAYSTFFENNLSPDELRELREAQNAEAEMPRLVALYREDHARLAALAKEYDRAATQPVVDSIRAVFDALELSNARIDERIGEMWESVFDSKSYIYSLIAEKLDLTDLSTDWARALEEMGTGRAELQGRYASDAVVDYVIQKRALVDHESAFAGTIGNAPAVDSLKRVARALPGPLVLEELERVVLSRKLLLDYADIKIGGSPYNAGNPIPEVKVWPRGIIYRVLVGAFSTAQPPSTFRGASPLAVQKGVDKRFRYFAGGFPSDSVAGVAVESMQKAGFKSPSAVVWMDGVYIDPAAGDAAGPYRLELSGADELSPRVKGAIDAEGAAAGDIVKSTEGFFVGPVHDAAVAIRLRTALDGAGKGDGSDGMTVKITEIPR